MMSEAIGIILAISAGTILIRCLPLLLQNLNLKGFWKNFIEVIPLAILTSLIFPGIVRANEDTNDVFLLILIPIVFIFLKLPVYLNLIISFFLFVFLSSFF